MMACVSQERSDVTDDVSAKMRGYLKILKTPKFSFYVAAYLDITEELSLLSHSFQADDLPISSVRANVEVAAISLRVQLADPGPHVRKIPQDLLEGTSDDDISRFNQDIKKTIENVLACIDRRFEAFYEAKVFLATEIFDPAKR